MKKFLRWRLDGFRFGPGTWLSGDKVGVSGDNGRLSGDKRYASGDNAALCGDNIYLADINFCRLEKLVILHGISL